MIQDNASHAEAVTRELERARRMADEADAEPKAEDEEREFRRRWDRAFNTMREGYGDISD